MTPAEEATWSRLENALRQRDLAQARRQTDVDVAKKRAAKRALKAGLSAERASFLVSQAQAEAERILRNLMPGDLNALDRAARTLVAERVCVYYHNQAENLNAMMRQQGFFTHQAVQDSLMGITYRLEPLPEDE